MSDMLFVVSRASLGDRNTKPCEGAERRTVQWIEERCVNDPTHRVGWENDPSPWYNAGANHRNTDRGIARDVPKERWAIELGSLPDLLAFIDKNEAIVMENSKLTHYIYPHILIYDDYI